jgi:hypothetical protein
VSRTRHDRLDKESLQQWLEPLGDVRLDLPVAGEVLRADVAFEQTRSRPAYRDKLGWLGRLLHRRMLFECFRNPPTDRELTVAKAKLVLFNEGLFRDARRRRQPAAGVERAWLCVLSPRLPLVQRQRFGMLPSAGFVAGVWSLPPAERTTVVALDELPAEASTMWLRLLGRGPVQEGAISELEGYDDREELVHATVALLLAWRRAAPDATEDPTMNPHLQQVYDRLEEKLKAEGKREGKREGKLEGKLEGLREAVETACELLAIRMTPRRRARLEALDVEELEAFLSSLRAQRSWPR